MFTAAYSIRYLAGVAGRLADGRAAAPADHGPPGPAFLAPAAVLAAVSVVLGVAPALVDGLVGAAAQALDAPSARSTSPLWHGLNLELLLSARRLWPAASCSTSAGPAWPG